MSNSLGPHGRQQTRLPCPSPTLRAWSNSCLLNWWCHPTVSSSVVLLSFCLQSFPVSGSFPLSQFFTSGGQSIVASVSASVFPVTIQDWFHLRVTGWISLQSKGLSRVFSNTTLQNHQLLALSFLYSPTLTSIHDYWENHSCDYRDLSDFDRLRQIAIWYKANFFTSLIYMLSHSVLSDSLWPHGL